MFVAFRFFFFDFFCLLLFFFSFGLLFIIQFTACVLFFIYLSYDMPQAKTTHTKSCSKSRSGQGRYVNITSFILLRWALSKQCPVLRRKMVVCSLRLRECRGSWRELYPPICSSKSFFHLFLIQELASPYETAFDVCSERLPIFASLSAFSLPLIPQWAGTHWRTT